MVHGKQICPAGHSREISGKSGSGGALRRQLQRLMKLFHSVPAAISGDSGKVMDNCIAYHREHRGQ